MNPMQHPEVVRLLDESFEAAELVDRPLLARFGAMSAAERSEMFHDYRRMYGEHAKEAYLPTSREVGQLLYTLARMRDAETIVEFGTSFGLSTVFLAAALASRGGGRVITTELAPSKAARARANLERVGLSELVEIRVGDALETLAGLPPTDMLYLDGAKPLYGRVLRLVEPALTPRAVVAADNVDFGDLVADFTDYVRDPAHGYTSTHVVVGTGSIEIAART